MEKESGNKATDLGDRCSGTGADRLARHLNGEEVVVYEGPRSVDATCLKDAVKRSQVRIAEHAAVTVNRASHERADRGMDRFLWVREVQRLKDRSSCRAVELLHLTLDDLLGAVEAKVAVAQAGKVLQAVEERAQGNASRPDVFRRKGVVSWDRIVVADL